MRAYATQAAGTATMTKTAAARAIGVSYQTLRKWIEAGYVREVAVGPPEAKIRRIPVSEVERLRATDG